MLLEELTAAGTRPDVSAREISTQQLALFDWSRAGYVAHWVDDRTRDEVPLTSLISPPVVAPPTGRKESGMREELRDIEVIRLHPTLAETRGDWPCPFCEQRQTPPAATRPEFVS